MDCFQFLALRMMLWIFFYTSQGGDEQEFLQDVHPGEGELCCRVCTPGALLGDASLFPKQLSKYKFSPAVHEKILTAHILVNSWDCQTV